MKRKMAIVGAGVLLALAVWAWRQGEGPAINYERVELQRGVLSRTLRETGLLAPRDPVVIKSRIAGVIEWIVEDGTWIDPGDRLYLINDEQAMREVTEARTRLFNNQQELALARLRRRHAERVESQKVISAKRERVLAETRLRILSATPKGDRRLIEIHEALTPLEQETQAVRARYEESQARFQKAQDEYLDHLDAWQQSKDSLLRTQAKIDEYLVRTEAKFDEGDPVEVAAREEDQQQLEASRSELAAILEALPALEIRRRDAEVARDAAAVPRNTVRAILEGREASERDLYIELEIEKRGVELVKLRLDLRISELDCEERRRKEAEGRASFASGAISQEEVERLASEVTAAEKEVEILEEKIAIAARPTAPEVLAEAQLKKEQASIRAKNVERVKDQNLQAIDREIEVFAARVDRLMHQIERLTKDFPAVIEFSIRFLEKELDNLEPDEGDRRATIEAELQRLAADLARVRETPPNIGTSRVGGVVKVVRRWGRAFNAGDHVGADTVIMEIFPAKNLEVRMAVNESSVDEVEKGMPVRVVVPALENVVLTGTVNSVGGVGRDKFHDRGNRRDPVFADVTEFETRVQLNQVPESLRTGMTVIVEVELDRTDAVLYLPRGAVAIGKDRIWILVGQPGSVARQEVTGRMYGADQFIVESGLTLGDHVYVQRRGSH